MNTRTDEAPKSVTHGMIAAALAALRALLIAGHVTLRDLWTDTGSGPGGVAGRVVEVSITDDPAALDALLSGMTQIEGPTEWTGSHWAYADYRGMLLTMPLLVTVRIDRKVPPSTALDPNLCYGLSTVDGHLPGYPPATCPECEPAPVVETPTPPPAAEGRGGYSCADHPGFVPTGINDMSEHLWEHHSEIAHDNPRPAAEPRVRPYITGADVRPLLELALDERFGPARGPVAPIEVVGQPGQSPDELVERFAGVQGIVIVPGQQQDDSLEAVWSRYARARALHAFGSKRYPTLEDARKAITYWPGFDMLLPGDLEILAGALLSPPRTPEPAPVRGIRRVFGRAAVAR